MAIVGGDHRQQAAEQRRGAERAYSFLDAAVDERLDVLVANELRGRRERRRGVARDLANVLRTRQPLRESFGDVEAPQSIRDYLTRQEILLHERSQRTPDAVLTRRYDRRVRNGNAQGMAEERRHSEPIGESTHHRRFRCRAEDAEPRVPRLEQPRCEKHERRQHEQRRRPAFHPVERRLSRRLVLQDLHVRGRAQPPIVTRPRSTR